MKTKFIDDQWEQLKRYDNFAKSKYGNSNFQIFYLTLFGNDASDQSGEDVDYLPISYKETIINWLERCIAVASRFPMVRETIIQYINHLKQLTNQDMDTKNKEEVVAILSKIENLRAAQAICQNYSAVFNTLVEKYFNPKMLEFAEEKGLGYNFENCDENYIKFHLTNPSWKGKCWIRFSFEGGRCFYGLWNNVDICRIPEEKRIVLREKIIKSGNIDRCNNPSEWWIFDVYYDNLTLDNWENDIINSNKFFEKCKEKIEILLKAMKNTDI